jgi:hypothetical protein
MEKIKLGLFDFFGYLLPGTIFLASICIFLDYANDFIIMHQLTFYVKKAARFIAVDNYFALATMAGILLSFCAGFMLHELGYQWYKYFYLYFIYNFLGAKFIILLFTIFIWKKDTRKEKIEKALNSRKEQFSLMIDTSSLTEKNVLIRHFSPNQIPFIDEWASKRAFAYNLSFSFFLLAIGIALFKTNTVNENILYKQAFIVLLIASFLLLERAARFNLWWMRDIAKTTEKFNLSDLKITEVEKK